MSAKKASESETRSGAPARHIDQPTAELDRLARTWLDLQGTRKALAQRELPDEIVEGFATMEARVSVLLKRALRKHPLWPWLQQFPGLGGAHTALVIGRIGDPRRYPGQRCSEGHYLPPIYAVGSPCPVAEAEDESDDRRGDGADLAGVDDHPAESEGAVSCPGIMLEPRPHSGVRSLWHWAGLSVCADGRAPRKRKGVQGDWEPRVRSSVMQPGGIAEQIVRLSVPHYSDIYRATKARLMLRVAEILPEIGPPPGDASLGLAGAAPVNERSNGQTDLGAAASATEIDYRAGRPLKLHEADRIARKVAAKAFLGDLLTEWKALV